MTLAPESNDDSSASLRRAAVRGAKWSAAAQICKQVTQFVTAAILANLLAPGDFGLVGMAMVVIGFVNIFRDLGTGPAIVREKTISDDFLSSIFWINVLFGLLGTITLWGLAPLVAEFYHDMRLTSVLRILSCSFIIAAPGITQQALLQRNLDFSRLGMIEVAALSVGGIVGISAALAGWGVSSLVAQSLTVSTVSTLLFWFVVRLRPSFRLSHHGLRDVCRFSLNLTGYSMFNYFVRNADYFLIGRFLGADALGYYTLAYRLMLYPLQNLTLVIGRVMYPVLARVQDNNVRFRTAYLKIVSSIAIVTFPMMAGLFLVAEPFVLAIYGIKWSPAISLIMILTPVGLIQSIGSSVGEIYKAKGRTDWMFYWGIFTGVVVVTAISVGLRWGIVGVATAFAIASFFLAYPNFAVPFRLIDLRVGQLLRELRDPFACTILMSLVVGAIRTVLPVEFSHGMRLVILVTMGVLAYCASTWMLNRQKACELYRLAGSAT